MSDMECPICPICGGDLIKGEDFPWFYSCQSTNWKSDADEICELDDCAASVPVWETLQRTRKALDVALDWLEQVATPAKCDDDLCREFTKRKLAEIKTALEQKE